MDALSKFNRNDKRSVLAGESEPWKRVNKDHSEKKNNQTRENFRGGPRVRRSGGLQGWVMLATAEEAEKREGSGVPQILLLLLQNRPGGLPHIMP